MTLRHVFCQWHKVLLIFWLGGIAYETEAIERDTGKAEGFAGTTGVSYD